MLVFAISAVVSATLDCLGKYGVSQAWAGPQMGRLVPP